MFHVTEADLIALDRSKKVDAKADKFIKEEEIFDWQEHLKAYYSMSLPKSHQ